MSNSFTFQKTAVNSSVKAIPGKFAAWAVGFALSTLALVTLLHFIDTGLQPSWHMVSEYAIGANGWIMQLAFVCWGLSCFAVYAAIRNQVATKAGKIGVALLPVVGLAVIAGGIFVMDAPTTPEDQYTLHGKLHGLSSMIGIPGQAIAALLISYSLKKNKQWSQVYKPVIWVAHTNWLSMVTMFITIAVCLSKTNGVFNEDVLIGWPNRLLVLAYCLWLIVVARKALLLTRSAGR